MVYLKVNLKREEQVVMVNSKAKMEQFIMEIGLMIFNLESDMKNGKINRDMKENIIMELKMELEYICVMGK